MTESLSALLAGAATYSAALQKLQGKTLAVDYQLPAPVRFKVLSVNSDYFVGQWQQKEFFCRFDMKLLLSLGE